MLNLRQTHSMPIPYLIDRVGTGCKDESFKFLVVI